jgi:hypothetical protein
MIFVTVINFVRIVYSESPSRFIVDNIGEIGMEKLHVFASKSSLLVLLIITIFLSGCYTAHSSNIQITPAPTCEPDTPHVYEDKDDDIPNKSTQYKKIANQIYGQAFVANHPEARQEAFRFLKYQTKRWTRVEDLRPDGEPKVRTIVVFISPDLIRAVILNHMLYKFDPNQDQNLENYIGSNLNRLKNANELVFMLIVQPEIRENKTFTISPQNIVLNNTSVLVITHKFFPEKEKGARRRRRAPCKL